MSDSDVSGSTLDETIERLLMDRGPLSVSELIDALRESGFDLGTDAEDELLTELFDSIGDEFAPLADGRWAYVPRPGHRPDGHALVDSSGNRP